MDSPIALVTRVYRSLPIWLAQEYLGELGGRIDDAECVQGKGWGARIFDAPDVVVGVVRVGQIQIVFEGSADAVARVITAFEKKALRAGG